MRKRILWVPVTVALYLLGDYLQDGAINGSLLVTMFSVSEELPFVPPMVPLLAKVAMHPNHRHSAGRHRQYVPLTSRTHVLDFKVENVKPVVRVNNESEGEWMAKKFWEAWNESWLPVSEKKDG